MSLLRDMFGGAAEYGKVAVGSAMMGIRVGLCLPAAMALPAAASVLQTVADIRGHRFENPFLDRVAKMNPHALDIVIGHTAEEFKSGKFVSPWTGKVSSERPSAIAGNMYDPQILDYASSAQSSLGKAFRSSAYLPALPTALASGLSGIIASIAVGVEPAIPIAVGVAAMGAGIVTLDERKYSELPSAPQSVQARGLPVPALVR